MILYMLVFSCILFPKLDGKTLPWDKCVRGAERLKKDFLEISITNCFKVCVIGHVDCIIMCMIC